PGPPVEPAVEAQASDRAHRIGQDKPVFIYKLIAAGTVEERIQELQVQKRALADTLFSDSGAAGLPRDGEALLELLGSGPLTGSAIAGVTSRT
ncbi:MAG: hypothetical protein ABR578_02320, partial [Chromatocurvus sp.]